MPTSTFQSGLFDSETHVLQLPDAELEYWSEFYEAAEADRLYQQILDETDWQQDTITVYGKQHLTPRLTCWVAEPWMDYSYSNHTMMPTPWTDVLLAIKERVESQCGNTFNSVLINYYRDGKDSNGWHSDDEPELGSRPVIASLSLGAARDFQLRHKIDKRLKHSISLEHGSLLMMRGSTQSHWQHHIPKRASAQGRINLTFRTIVQVR